MARTTKPATRAAAPKTAAAPKPPAPKSTAAKTKLSAKELKALARLIELGHVAKLRTALARKPDVDTVVKLPHHETTLLHMAALSRDDAPAMVKLLLDAGANPNLKLHGDTALHVAREGKTVTALVAAGADPNARDDRKRTPLHTTQNAEVAAALLAAGAEVDPVDKEGKTPYAGCEDLAMRAVLRKHGSKGLPSANGKALSPRVGKGKPKDIEVTDGAIGIDRDGNVWIGGDGVIHRFDGKETTRFTFKESFSVAKIAPGAKKSVYFATNWGLVTFEAGTFRLWSMETSEIHDNHLTGLTVDTAGKAYLLGYGDDGGTDRHVGVFDGKTFGQLTIGKDVRKGLEVVTIGVDAKDRPIFGTASGIVFPDGTKWPKRDGEEVRAIAIDGEETWVGTYGDLRSVKGGAKIETDGVAALAVHRGIVWAATGGGLLRIEGKTTKRFTTEDSKLPDDDVQGVAIAADGTVWIVAGDRVAWTHGETIVPFDGKPVAARGKNASATKTAPTKASTAASATAKSTAKAEAGKKAKAETKPATKLAPRPKVPFVPRAKLPAFVVDAVNGCALENLDADLILAVLRPSIGFDIGAPIKDAPVGSSKFGGRPDLRDEAEWPVFEDDEDRFLPFLLQVNAADVAPYDLEGLLPKKGLLSFFAETVPDELEQSKVLYAETADPKSLRRASWPEDLELRKKEVDFVAQLPEHAIAFYPTWTLPSASYFAQFVELTAVDRRALHELEGLIHAEDPKNSSTTRLLGWPNSVQGDVTSPKATILLQLDAGANYRRIKPIHTMFQQWGSGLVHFVVTNDELARRALDEAEAYLSYT